MRVLKALSDPTRRRIVEMLAQGALAAGEIAGRFEVSGAAVSQHLKVLREARVVKVRADRQRRIYELDPAGVEELAGWVASIQAFWSPRLEALEQALGEEQRRNGYER